MSNLLMTTNKKRAPTYDSDGTIIMDRDFDLAKALLEQFEHQTKTYNAPLQWELLGYIARVLW